MTHHDTPDRQATFTSVDDARAQSLGPTSLRYLLEASHGGAYSVIELQIAPGFTGPPMLHHHTREEASFIVLEGTLAITTKGVERRVGPGGLAHLPPGVDFVWRNASGEAPARALCIYAPAGFEQMFVDVERAVVEHGGPPGPELMQRVMPPIWQKYGIGLAPR